MRLVRGHHPCGRRIGRPPRRVLQPTSTPCRPADVLLCVPDNGQRRAGRAARRDDRRLVSTVRDNTKEHTVIDMTPDQYTASLLIGGCEMSVDQTPLHNPARLTDVVGTVSNASAGLAAAAVDEAHRAFAHWSSLKAARRAEVLTRAADAVEADAAMLA